MCHSPLSNTNASVVYLPKFIHQIHAAIDVAQFPARIRGAGYKDVTYPQPISNCVVCHTASGKVLGAGNKIDNWKNNPTIEICGSCHTAVNFATGAGHLGGIKVNGSCVFCHDAAYIATKHNPATAAKNVPEYNAAMTITAPANGTYYVVGETPTVKVTLTDHQTAAAVPGALYLAAKHAAGSTVAGSLAKASLYVYGPRANAKPVLTNAAATLSAAGVATQAQSLFVATTDAQITTDATGFSYKLSAIPIGMSGTFMVRFIAANYSYVSDTNYKIDSTAFKTIQIGTATAEPKISGNGCVDCHGSGTLGVHDARHSVVFDTDECISCHDKSGNHADPLDNRVHAIHAASKTGDKLGLDWSSVTYPQGMPTYTNGVLTATAGIRCITCHTTTSTLYKTSVSSISCVGCHSGKPGVSDHFLQMGGK
jgi:OmcA/MtrC family decaheme c-type cytochrome